VAGRAPFPTRFAALLLVFITLGHALVAFDLVFHLLSPTPEIVALWGAPNLVKVLWLLTTTFGVVGFLLLYRSHLILGLLASLSVTALLYFASTGLWHDLKGTFWLAAAVNVLVIVGIWRARSNNSFKPNPLRGSA
jgi:hypothetical protein